eukprot:16511-Heterococcus_DN1.PRE.5
MSCIWVCANARKASITPSTAISLPSNSVKSSETIALSALTASSATPTAGTTLTKVCSTRSANCILALSFLRGKGVGGTGTPRNLHSGSHPSVTEYTSKRSAGTAAFTCSQCVSQPVISQL